MIKAWHKHNAIATNLLCRSFRKRRKLSVSDDVAIFPVRISNAIAAISTITAQFAQRNHLDGQSTPAALVVLILPARNQVQYMTIHASSVSGGLTFDVKPKSVSVTDDLQLKFTN